MLLQKFVIEVEVPGRKDMDYDDQEFWDNLPIVNDVAEVVRALYPDMDVKITVKE